MARSLSQSGRRRVADVANESLPPRPKRHLFTSATTTYAPRPMSEQPEPIVSRGPNRWRTGAAPNKVAAIGFCFGGLCVLDLARSGFDVRGVASFRRSRPSLPTLLGRGAYDPVTPAF